MKFEHLILIVLVSVLVYASYRAIKPIIDFCKDLFFSKRELILWRNLENRFAEPEKIIECSKKLPSHYLSSLEKKLINYCVELFGESLSVSKSIWVSNITSNAKIKKSLSEHLIILSQRAILDIPIEKLASNYFRYMIERNRLDDFVADEDNYCVGEKFIFDVILNHNDYHKRFFFIKCLKDEMKVVDEKYNISKSGQILLEADFIKVEKALSHS